MLILTIVKACVLQSAWVLHPHQGQEHPWGVEQDCEARQGRRLHEGKEFSFLQYIWSQNFPLEFAKTVKRDKFIVFMKVRNFQLPCTREARNFPLGNDQNCETGQGRLHEGRSFHFSSTYEARNFSWSSPPLSNRNSWRIGGLTYKQWA